MIRAEDEDIPTMHRSPDSDYYADLLSRVDSAVANDEERDVYEGEQRGGPTRGIGGFCFLYRHFLFFCTPTL